MEEKKLDYRKEVINMVKQINNEDILKYIYIITLDSVKEDKKCK